MSDDEYDGETILRNLSCFGITFSTVRKFALLYLVAVVILLFILRCNRPLYMDSSNLYAGGFEGFFNIRDKCASYNNCTAMDMFLYAVMFLTVPALIIFASLTSLGEIVRTKSSEEIEAEERRRARIELEAEERIRSAHRVAELKRYQ